MTETISEEQLLAYQKVYEEVFGRSIPRKLAYEEAIKLLNLCRVLMKHSAKTHKDEKPETLQDNIVNKR